MNKYYHYKSNGYELYFLENSESYSKSTYFLNGRLIKNVSGSYKVNIFYSFWKDYCTLVTDIDTIKELDKIVIFS